MSEAMCKGDWMLGSACGRCSRCIETAAPVIKTLRGHVVELEARAAPQNDEIQRLREDRRRLFEMISEWMTPLFQLRMQMISVQGRIDGQINDLRKAWFEEHGYPGEPNREVRR